MRTERLCCVLTGLLLISAVCEGQPSGTAPPPPLPAAIPAPLAPPASPQSIDQLLNSLTDIRAKKAALEEQEKTLIAELRTRLKEQKERLAKLGISPDEPQTRIEKTEKKVYLPFDTPKISEKK
jgi:hypothetical protein